RFEVLRLIVLEPAGIQLGRQHVGHPVVDQGPAARWQLLQVPRVVAGLLLLGMALLHEGFQRLGELRYTWVIGQTYSPDLTGVFARVVFGDFSGGGLLPDAVDEDRPFHDLGQQRRTVQRSPTL